MGTALRIRKLRFTEVVVPGRPGTINSPQLNKPLHKLAIGGQTGWSVQFDEVPKLILELSLENGVTGLGEFYRGHDWPTVANMARRMLEHTLGDFPLQALPLAWCREYDGFECAVWDAYAKAHGLRVVDLLGGSVRQRIKVGAWTGHRMPDEIGELAAGFAEHGYDSFKFKCDDQDDVVAWCREVARHAPEMRVILDPNERWRDTGHAKQLIRRLQEIGNVFCIEDPIPRWQLADYALLRQFGAIPVVLHVSLPYVSHGQRVHDAINAITHGAVDGFNFNCGLANFQRLDHIAQTANLRCWHGSELDLGILEAMYLHSAAAAPSCVWPSDIFGRMVREHDLLQRPLQIDPPYADLPEGPGLGVELDQQALTHYQTQQHLIEA